jgi:hypothetical protein
LVKGVAEYHSHAEECRTLARSAANPVHRETLIKMAETWEALAADRTRNLERRVRLAELENSLSLIPQNRT